MGIRKSERWHFREGWGILFLSLSLVMITGLAVASAGWTEGLGVIPMAYLGAFVIGLMMAKSLLPGWIAHLFSLIIGFAWSFRLVTTVFQVYYTWQDRWNVLWWRIYQWIYKLAVGGVSYDNLVFVLQMALIGWGISYLTVWFTFRSRKIWHAVIPGGALLLVNLYYAPNDLNIYFILYLALALLLIIRFNLFAQQQTWRRKHVHFNTEISFDFLRAGTLFTVLIIALAWVTPSAVTAEGVEVFEGVEDTWRDLQAEWNRLFASLNYRPTTSPDFYGKALPLGGPRELSDAPVLEVEAPPSARYWRAVVFDEFTGRGWQNSDESRAPFGADSETLPIITYRAQGTISQKVTALRPGMTLLAMAAQPIWVSQPARATFSYVNIFAGGASGGLEDTASVSRIETISFVRSRVDLDAGDSYTVVSLLTEASMSQLQRAGVNYPAWISDRYLQLPDTTTDRVKQLAEEITSPYDNPYDKATAVESFLRSEITYNEKIDAPPLDRDPVDYVLFDLKQGYCDYYATAMTVMLRSQGIPARIASGYAQGEYDSAKQAYVVLQRNAHTWVEIFFPNYGWIEFEPTAGQLTIARPTGPLEEDPSENLSATPTPPEEKEPNPQRMDAPTPEPETEIPWWIRLNLTKPTPWIWGGLMLIAMAAVAIWFVRRRETVPMSHVQSIYTNMLRLAGWAGLRTDLSQTPYEHASALGQVLPEGAKPARRIAGLYARERYGHKTSGASEQGAANDAWWTLRPLLTQAVLRHLLQRRGK